MEEGSLTRDPGAVSRPSPVRDETRGGEVGPSFWFPESPPVPGRKGVYGPLPVDSLWVSRHGPERCGESPVPNLLVRGDAEGVGPHGSGHRR